MSEPVIDLDEVRFLRDQGVCLEAIARQLGVTTDGIEKALQRRTPRGRCSVCGVDAGVRVDGLIRVHGWASGREGNCPGSARQPAPAPDEVVLPTPRPIDRREVDHWLELVACRDTDPETFFDSDPGPALRTCRRCPVAAQCLDHAIALRADSGVWGGLTEGERSQLRSRA